VFARSSLTHWQHRRFQRFVSSRDAIIRCVPRSILCFLHNGANTWQRAEQFNSPSAVPNRPPPSPHLHTSTLHFVCDMMTLRAVCSLQSASCTNETRRWKLELASRLLPPPLPCPSSSPNNALPACRTSSPRCLVNVNVHGRPSSVRLTSLAASLSHSVVVF